MAKKIETGKLYFIVTLIFFGFFAYDIYRSFSQLESAKETLGENKYAAKIEATKKLMKVFEQPLFSADFFNQFKNYGQPISEQFNSRGPGIFDAPAPPVEQLLDLSKEGDNQDNLYGNRNY